MVRFAVALGLVVLLGAVIAVAFGANALWVFGFFAAIAVLTALGVGVGGAQVTAWSRRRFEQDDPGASGREERQ